MIYSQMEVSAVNV